MIKVPIKIKKCPISEAVFEIRFSSDYPIDAIFGILYGGIKDFFTEKPVFVTNFAIARISKRARPDP